MKTTELRTHSGEVRIAGKRGRRLDGYAVVFNRYSDPLGDFIERIDPHAFDAEDAIDSTTYATFNHERNNLLGTLKAETLRLEIDDFGVRYEIDTPDTATGNDVLELVRRGDVDGSSFAFTCHEDRWEMDKKPAVRTVLRATLHELGPVIGQAYQDTSVAVRQYEQRIKGQQSPSEKINADRWRRQRKLEGEKWF